VLTAHPTEARRKTLLDAENSVAGLLGEREHLRSERERHDNEALLKARVVQMWQTRLLRFASLTVGNEIENALSYYHTTLLREIPRLYAELEKFCEGEPIAPFFRMGSWIGGDRDGNPNVDAGTLKEAFRQQSEIALRHYLAEAHELGAELSMSQLLVGCTDALAALAERSGDTNPHRQDVPYRRAIVGIYGRLAATLEKLTGATALRQAVTPVEPYESADEFQADLAVIEASLRAHHGVALVPGRLTPLRRAVQVFGFHLATVDLRQSSDQHEAVVAELLKVAKLEDDYSALDEAARRNLLIALLHDTRPLRVHAADYSEHTKDELAIFEATTSSRTPRT
jgi:phosphoenolpyruvate carboxylase